MSSSKPRHPVTSTSSAHLVTPRRARSPRRLTRAKPSRSSRVDHVVGTVRGLPRRGEIVRRRLPADGRFPASNPRRPGKSFLFQLRRSDGRFPASVRRSRRPWTSRLQPQHVDDERCASPEAIDAGFVASDAAVETFAAQSMSDALEGTGVEEWQLWFGLWIGLSPS